MKTSTVRLLDKKRRGTSTLEEDLALSLRAIKAKASQRKPTLMVIK